MSWLVNPYILGAGIYAYGGTVTYSVIGNETYVTHTFTTSGANTFTVSKGSANVQYLVVGGGGGAGGTQNSISIGGDGGQVLQGTTFIDSTQTINVGVGGTAGPGWSTTVGSTSGGDSTIGSLVVANGGKGGANSLFSGTQQYSMGTGGSNTSAAGLSPGAGITSTLSGASVVYGTTYTNAALDTNPAARANNTGDGGQPVWSNASRAGGAGGSGIVILRYKIEISQSFDATGGSLTSLNGYKYHVFTTEGASTFLTGDNPINAQVLIIGGGGAGGTGESWGGGGGGAGGVRLWNVVTFAPNTSNTITVGSGGIPSPNASAIGGSGGTSSVTHMGGTLSAAGGGGGGASWSINDGGAGGSGGGGSFDGTGYGGTANGIGIGNNGGNGGTNGLNWRGGGGGGGYSAAGTTPTGSVAGVGGQGYSIGSDLTSILGATHSVVASGGGAGHEDVAGGAGGTGAGTGGTGTNATSYGSGGGGGKNVVGGYGKSGVVIIRYPSAS